MRQRLIDDRTAQTVGRNLGYSLVSLRLKLAMLRFRFLAWKAGFDPNQPRVPAGVREGGQWTDADGPLGANRPRLEDEEGRTNRRGQSPGHTITEHVRKTPGQLKAAVHRQQNLLRRVSRIRRLRLVARLAGKALTFSAGSFTSVAAANRLVRVALARNEDLVRSVASGEFTRKRAIEAHFKSKTGVEAYARGLQKPKMRDTYGVRVVIVHDPDLPKGYRIVSAFPIR